MGSMTFKNFKEDTKNEIYFYGEIVSSDWKWEESDVSMQDFNDEMAKMDKTKEIDIYINSPGGSVTAGVAMLNRLKRFTGTKNVYIDSLAASITGVISMCYDNLFVYNTSMLMVHPPMGGITWGYNAAELREDAETLDKIEENMIIPAYLSKTTLSEEEMKESVKVTSWWGAEDIKANFKNVTILEEDKTVVACIKDKNILNKYKNTPGTFRNFLESEPKPQESKVKNNNEIEVAKAKLKLMLEI